MDKLVFKKDIISLCFTLALLLTFKFQLQAQVSGTIFKDFNMDGTKGTVSPNLDVGMAGVQVVATKPDGTPLTVTYTGGGTSTNNTGGYSVSGGTLGQIRLEFIMPDSYTFASKGAAGGTSIMFPTTATQNLAVNYPADYCGVSDPMLVTSCYVGNNAAGANDVLVKYAYSSTGATHSASHATIALANQIGSTYGVAYDRQNQNLYAGAFLKRHIPLKDNDNDGKEDIGAIYKIPNSGSPTLWLDVTTLGVDVGMSLMPTIAQRALPVPATTSDLAASHDTQVFPLVGKIGLGDVEISDDNSQLFFVNLHDSKIYTVDIATKTLVGSGIAVPSACTGGNGRPFALAYHRGKLYVGSVCDAITSKADADMSATIYRLDGTSFTNILSYPLNYTKGAAFTWGGTYGNKWNPWEDSFSGVFGFISPTNLNALCEPQPMLGDILFDTDESIIMVFIDRLGHQTGTANFQPSTSDTKLYYGIAAGDILRASLVSGTYVLENNAASGGVTTAGAGNGQGPGTPTATGYTSPSGEFYVGDDENNVHQEVIAGGAAIVPGRGQVAAQVSDPAQNYFGGGTYWFNNTTGEYDQFYVVFADATMGTKPWLFGKANGLGDLEVMCNNAPIEIGNRVWDDTDKDGIQDAGEAGISNVTVTLYQADGTTAITTATTDANGNYYFSSATGTNTTSAKYGLSLAFNSNYVVGFPTAVSTKTITALNTGANDLIDSDANASTGKIAFTTGYAGENNHSFDVGYSTCTTPTATASATQPSCSGTNAPNNGGITIAGFTTGQRYQYSSGATFNSGAATPATITAIPAGGVITSTLANTTGSYTVRVYDATDNTCFVDRVVSITAVTCCTPPTATASATNATCTGPTANSDAKITIAGFTTGQRYQYSSGATFNSGAATPASITAIPAGGVIVNTLPNTATSYTVRIYDATDNTCYVDRVVSTTVTNCNCPNVVAPAVADASRCGAGTVVANISTACASGTTMKIYSDAGLTTDVTSSFTIGASTVTSSSISSTTTYYAACVDNTFTTCKSAGDSFILTITATPTATASATQPSCSGTNAPNNGGITIAGFTTGQRYQYSTGATFTSGSAIPASITTIPAGGVITSTLANTTGSYTVRIYDATDNTCYVDRVVNLTAVVCCTVPTNNIPTALAGTCTGSNVNNDASISITGITGNKAAISSAGAATFNGAVYASATSVVGGSITFSNLQHGVSYIIRIYSQSDTCYKDVTVSTPTRTCCPSPNCGTLTIIKN